MRPYLKPQGDFFADPQTYRDNTKIRELWSQGRFAEVHLIQEAYKTRVLAHNLLNV